MSHVAKIELEVRDLEALKEAARRLGLEFREGQKTYRWWGTHLAGYPIPQGFTAEDLGRCDHALRAPGREDAFEVGVAFRDGRYHLLWDFYGTRGAPMQKAIGPNGGKLRQAYAIAEAKIAARKKGYSCVERTLPNGSVQLTVRVP